jgi:hypothetical protein
MSNIIIDDDFNRKFSSEHGMTFAEYIRRNVLRDMDIVRFFNIKIYDNKHYVIMNIDTRVLLFNIDMIYKLYSLYESNNNYTISYHNKDNFNIVDKITNNNSNTTIVEDLDEDNATIVDHSSNKISELESNNETIAGYISTIDKLQTNLHSEKEKIIH